MVSGRKTKPAILHQIEGTHQKSRHALPIDEVQFEDTNLICPEILTGSAKNEWERLAPSLQRLGLLTYADEAIFTSYCLLVQTMTDRPEDMTAALFGQLRGACSDLGLTPAARSAAASKNLKNKKQKRPEGLAALNL